MTNVKKVVAVALAFLMIFSSVSVLASAWDASVDDGFALDIETKFFKEVNGEWVETTKVKPGDTVKARVYLGTDYYSNDSSLLFFYDKDFFSFNDTYSANADSAFVTANNVTVQASGSPVLDDLIAEGCIDDAFVADYNAISAVVMVDAGGDSAGDTNVQYDNTDWLIEFDLTVLDSASGEGDLFVKDTTVQNTDNVYGTVNVPKGEASGTDLDVWSMWLWDANVTLNSNPVSTLSTVTYKANGGTFADGSDTIETEGTIDDTIAIDEPVATQDGYAFMGWVDASDATPTYEEIVKAPTTYPENDLVLNAYWMETVDITFDTGAGTPIETITGAKPYDTFATIEDPTLDGYTFKGWDVKGGDLPATYPDADTTYTAIWAKQVTVTLVKDDGTQLGSYDGDAGDAFEETIAEPTKEGHYFIYWNPELPTVYPAEDTTYTANFEAYSYKVEYYIDGKLQATTNVQFGKTIPTTIPYAGVLEGYKLDGWYTDAAYTSNLDDTVMGTGALKLYARTVPETYDAIFMVDNTVYATVPTAFDAPIELPAEPAKAGYEFKGWTPYPGIMEAGDMTFEAVWAEAEQQVQYILDDDQNWETFKLDTGAEMEIPADPVKEGYTFLHWSETKGGEAATIPAVMPAGNLAYYAVFEVNEYTITFDSQEGSDVEDITQDYNTAITAPADPTRTGYTFKGWATSAGVTDASQAVALPEKMPAYDSTYYAIWVINQYTITFNTDGGSEIAAITQDYGSSVTAPGNPSKTGYTFTGWDKSIPGTMPAENITITAQWEINQYTITFDSNGGTAVGSITQDYNTDVTAPAAPTKTGYTFTGWEPAVPAKMPAEDVTLVAQWKVNQYTITFNTDGGSDVAAITQDYDTDVTAPADPSKTGYTFTGWDKVIPSKMPAENITITAQWKINQYTITFDTDGGSAVGAITQDYDTAVTAPANPTKEGHTFTGWSPAVPAKMPAENTTVVAQWEPNTYKVTWKYADNVTADKVDNVVYGTAITAPADPTRTGYTFTGWTPDVAAEMPAQNLEYTATWKANVYDAVFYVDGEVYATVPTAFDSDIIAPANPTKAGYVFSTWTPTVGKMNSEDGLEFNAVWINATDTQYKVETYTMNTEGVYELTSTETKAGTTGDTVNVKPASVAAGFALDDASSKYEGEIAADSSLVLKVYISRNQYTFTTNVDGAESSTEYYFEAAIATPEEPSKTGYEFAAWEPSVPAKMPAEDVTVNATWTANSDTAYKVIVHYSDDKNGDMTAEFDFEGTTDKAIAIVDVVPDPADENTEYVLMSDLAINHYELDASAANQMTGTVAADGSTVLNIYYVPVKYTITFNAVEDGAGAYADGDTTKTAVLEYNSLAVNGKPATDPAKTGYTFQNYSGLTDSTYVTGNRTYNAHYTVNQYTFTYIIDGVETSEDYDYGAIINKPVNPSKTGYTFIKWSSEIPDNMPANDVTVTAEFKINQYTITFNTDGGSDVAAITQDYDTDVTAPANPTKTGYTFTGWDKTVPATMPAEDITITAQWKINQYTISFENTGDSTIGAITQDYGTAVTAPGNPSKTGYTFAGWDKTIPATMPAEDVIITAKWDINQYTIKFDSQEGTAVDSVTADYNSEVAEPAAPTKDGYTFGGWATSAGVTDASQKVAFPVIMPLNGTTYYAIWTAKDYTITFDENGGTEVADITAPYKSAITAPANPTKEGHTFGGWATTAAPTTKVDLPTSMPLDGASYIAIWTANTYTVTWKYADGVTADKIENVVYGTAITETVPTRTGYTFKGWTPDVAAEMPAQNLEYTATWEANVYDAVFYVDGEVYATVPTAFDSDIIAPANPTKAGYVFSTWDPAVGKMNSEDGLTFNAVWVNATDTQYTVKTYTMNTAGVYELTSTETKAGTTGDTVNVKPASVADGFALDDARSKYEGEIAADNSLVLEVYISRNQYTFTTNVDGTESSTVYYYGATVAAPTAPTKTGYTFGGWSGTVPSTMPAEDVTVTAQWTINQYTITFDSNGGSAVNAITQDYNTDVTAPADPTKTGHTFTGWEPAVPSKMPAENMTVVAQWSTNSYTITFDSNSGSDVADITAPYESDITVPADPTRTGYTFTGWYNAAGEKVSVPAKMPLNGLALTAGWDINKYDVKYYTDAEKTALYQTSNVEYNTVLSDITVVDPAKTGYSFLGWSYDGKTVLDLAAEKVPVGGVELVAVWSINSYAANFRANGGAYEDGSNLKTITVIYGEAINVPEVPTRAGWTFTGWAPAVPETMPAEVQNFLAQWTQETYTITWMSDNAAVSGFETEAHYGDTIESHEMTKTGYTFNGWVYNGTTYAAGETITIADAGKDGAAIEMTASWTANTYDAIFNANGGAWADGDTTKTVPTVFDTAIDTTNIGLTKDDAAAPTRAGYVFGGWTPAVGNMTSADGMTFTASWIANTDTQYTVETYIMNTEGTYDMTSEIKGAATDTVVNVEPESYEPGFKANAEDSVYEGKVTADNKLVLKVYIDRESYNVVTKVDGEVTSTESKLFGSTVKVPALLTKEGYTFSGWKVNGTEYAADAEVTVPVDGLTIEGSFKVNQYDAVFTVDGSVYATVPTDFGKVPVAPADPSKTGYTFTGWTPALAEMTTAGATYEAEFSANTDTAYKVEIYTMGLDGQYTLTDTIDKTGTTGENVSYTAEAKTGFSTETVTDEVKADGSTVLKAYYVRNQYTITYNVDGEEYKEETYYFGENIAILGNPTKEGYTFGGWKIDGAMAFLPATMPANNIVVEGAFTVNTYNLIYVVDGVTYKTVPYEFGADITAEANPVKEGYTFSGWSTIPATMPAADTTITGSFSINTYNLIYVVDGETYKTVPYEYDAPITAEAAPVKEGYTFSGWSTIPGTMPAADTTITGSFTVNQYDAVFNVQGKEFATVATNYGEIPVAPTKAEIEAAYPGYTFVEWSPALAEMTTAGATYNAVLTANEGIAYTVETYKMNTDGSTYAMTSETLYGTAGETATAATPELEGFTYNSGLSTVSGTIAGDGSLVLKVYYDRNKITVNVNGETDDYYYGEEIQEPAAPEVPNGYEQDGWVDEDGNEVEFPYTVPDEEDAEITIKPVFVPKEYKVTFVSDGATYEEKQVAYLSVIGLPEAPVKAGYTFIGWFNANDAKLTAETTMPASDVTYTAVFETTTPAVNYYVNNAIVGTVSGEYGKVIPTTVNTYTVPTGYTFDGWYIDAACTTAFNGETFGSGVTALYAKETANTYNAVFYVDGEVYATVETAFDDAIVAPADPVKAGYTFLGWDPYVGIMEEEGMEFNATWIETANAFSITYIVENETYETFTLALNDEFEVPADPVKEGYAFVGWATTPDATAAEVLPEKMPAQNLTYYAIFSQSSFTITYYDYEASEKGPAGEPTPGYEVYTTQTYAYNAPIVLPAEPEIEHYIFTGWVDAEGNAFTGTNMPDEDFALYATYEREIVKLVPVEGATTMIERDGNVESYNDGYSVITDAYDYSDVTDYSEWYIYGLAVNMTLTKLESYITVHGDGYYEVTLVEGQTSRCGTGAVVKVYDNVTGKLVEQFYIIIFGDIDGNGRITGADASEIKIDVSEREWSAVRGGVAYLKKAASVDGNSRVSSADGTRVSQVVSRDMTLDQVTGIAE